MVQQEPALPLQRKTQVRPLGLRAPVRVRGPAGKIADGLATAAAAAALPQPGGTAAGDPEDHVEVDGEDDVEGAAAAGGFDQLPGLHQASIGLGVAGYGQPSFGANGLGPFAGMLGSSADVEDATAQGFTVAAEAAGAQTDRGLEPPGEG
ncbi:hypothetical protein PLESTM_000938300 [Pleodorina starrii]|nr:hypothetical protein PLESTM_000938300 [Pleodorina starrii]